METKEGIKVLKQTIDNAHSKSIPQGNENPGTLFDL